MTEAASINAVMRALADPTRRAVFERVVSSDEITVVELTRGSGVTQGAISQHLKALKQAGLVAERPEGRKVYYRAQPEGLEPLVDWMSYSAMPDLFTIHAASLDDPDRYVPQMVTYTLRGQAWDRPYPAVPQFEKMPPL
ncbi:ArsR family transcriptional regulator [Sinorhizobium medicae]|uniref:ArsR/SmtB family transcription factor n=1 Tax=Sinorhizobium medicae TaxID=110321 RepID=UPI000FD8291B|nr:metalloregulator ArsR/SmtB family transcription factor [Sinorhizobium medicae]RVK23557.1 ArsR family transcriptional regulator [Sinorhizobium medicae]